MAPPSIDVDPFDAELPWNPFTIPGSDRPVRMLRLEAGAPGGPSTALVRFPPGWARPAAGHYACDEEFVILEGGLRVSGVTYGAGDRGWIPRGAVRSGSASEPGALALAWFSGVPKWTEGPPPAGPAGQAERTPLATVPVPAGGLPLRRGDAGETRLYEAAPALLGEESRVLWLGGPRWTAHGPGEPLAGGPGRSGRVFVHLRYSI